MLSKLWAIAYFLLVRKRIVYYHVDMSLILIKYSFTYMKINCVQGGILKKSVSNSWHQNKNHCLRLWYQSIGWKQWKQMYDCIVKKELSSSIFIEIQIVKNWGLGICNYCNYSINISHSIYNLSKTISVVLRHHNSTSFAVVLGSFKKVLESWSLHASCCCLINV